MIISHGIIQPNQVFSYNSTVDSDMDGILDGDDHCPYGAERYNDYKDEDGCPDIPPYESILDSDMDGIFDHYDSCPKYPETYNKFQDEDGCPDTLPSNYSSYSDSDDDWISDVADHCPNQPETYNKFQDEDGCPDKIMYVKDSDGDGIQDIDDLCDLLPENYNKLNDTDGCPDDFKPTLPKEKTTDSLNDVSSLMSIMPIPQTQFTLEYKMANGTIQDVVYAIGSETGEPMLVLMVDTQSKGVLEIAFDRNLFGNTLRNSDSLLILDNTGDNMKYDEHATTLENMLLLIDIPNKTDRIIIMKDPFINPDNFGVLEEISEKSAQIIENVEENIRNWDVPGILLGLFIGLIMRIVLEMKKITIVIKKLSYVIAAIVIIILFIISEDNDISENIRFLELWNVIPIENPSYVVFGVLLMYIAGWIQELITIYHKWHQ